MSDENQGLMQATAQKKETKTVVDTSGLPSETQNTPAPEVGTKPYEKVDWEKRYSDMRSYLSKKENEWKEKQTELEAAAKQARPSYIPPKSAEELEQFKKDNPDIYGVVETVAHMKAEGELKTIQTEIEDLKRQRENNERAAAMAELKTYHPDFEAIKESDLFHKWADDQPKEIRSWLFEKADARLASRAIDLFKAEVSQARADNQGIQKQDSADAVTTKGAVETVSSGDKKVWHQSEIAKMSIQQYEKLRTEIDEAFVDGRVLPD